MTPEETAKEIITTTDAQMNRYPPSWKAIKSLASECLRLTEAVEIKEDGIQCAQEVIDKQSEMLEEAAQIIEEYAPGFTVWLDKYRGKK